MSISESFSGLLLSSGLLELLGSSGLELLSVSELSLLLEMLFASALASTAMPLREMLDISGVVPISLVPLIPNDLVSPGLMNAVAYALSMV